MKNSSEYREKKNLLFMLVLMVHSIRYCYMASIGKPRKKSFFFYLPVPLGLVVEYKRTITKKNKNKISLVDNPLTPPPS